LTQSLTDLSKEHQVVLSTGKVSGLLAFFQRCDGVKFAGISSSITQVGAEWQFVSDTIVQLHQHSIAQELQEAKDGMV
jgi:hypothetical protein